MKNIQLFYIKLIIHKNVFIYILRKIISFIKFKLLNVERDKRVFVI